MFYSGVSVLADSVALLVFAGYLARRDAVTPVAWAFERLLSVL